MATEWDRNYFPSKEEFTKEFVAIDFADYHCDEDFYKVDKASLETLFTREERGSQALFPNGIYSDKQIVHVIIKTVGSLAKFLTGHAVTISFTEISGKNHALFDGQSISVSLSPLYDHRVPINVRINSVIESGLHELYHCKYTTPGMESLLIREKCTKKKLNTRGKTTNIADFSKVGTMFANALNKDLVNIVEDYRIEENGMKDFPGYVYYFDDGRRYALWRRHNIALEKIELPSGLEIKAIHPIDINQKLLDYIMNEVLAPELFSSFDMPTDKRFLEKKAAADIILQNESAESYIQAHDKAHKLLQLFDAEFQEYYESTQRGLSLPTIELSADEASQLIELIEKLVKDDPDLNVDGSSVTIVQVPENDRVEKSSQTKQYTEVSIIDSEPGEFDQKVYEEALAISQTIANNLSFLDSRCNRTREMYELNSGELDSDELYSLSFNRNIFYSEETASGYSLDFGILIDESGSMWGEKIKEARLAGLALALALQHSEYINLYVYGHTADRGDHDISMYRYFDPQEKVGDINNMFSVQARSNNADGYAIAKMGQILQKGKARQKVLIVASDGQPACSGYNYDYGSKQDDGILHTAAMVQKLERQGIFVMQVAIGNKVDSEKMFSHFVEYNGATLGESLRKVLTRKLMEISNTF